MIWWSCHIDPEKKSLQCIPAAAFLCGERHESGDRHTLIGVMVNPNFSGTPDPAPFPDKACASEKITLDDHAVEAPHVLRWILAAKPGLIRKDIELHGVTISSELYLAKHEVQFICMIFHRFSRCIFRQN